MEDFLFFSILFSQIYFFPFVANTAMSQAKWEKLSFFI